MMMWLMCRRLLVPMLILCLAGCESLTSQDYSLETPAQILSVLAAPAIRDGRARFRQIFQDLIANDPNFETYSEATQEFLLRLSDEPPVPEGAARKPSGGIRLRVLIVAGLFDECISDVVNVFETARTDPSFQPHRIEEISVSGRSSCDYNAGLIAEAVEGLTLHGGERLLLLGHSKGAADILHFLVNYPETAKRVSAVVSVAGAINGSLLAEKAAGWYDKLAGWSVTDRCDAGDGEALENLKRSFRLNWLAAHPLPQSIPCFSAVAFTDRQRVNSMLKPGYDLLKPIDPRNDGLLLFHDQVIPGATLLGYANADHWSVVYPIEEKHPRLASALLQQEPFPRNAFLRAILLYVAEYLQNGEVDQ